MDSLRGAERGSPTSQYKCTATRILAMPTYHPSTEYSHTSEGQQLRREWVNQTDPGVNAGTMLVVDEVSEAKATFVDGYFLGSFFVAVAAIEQILHEQLPVNDDRPWPLHKIAEKALDKDVIDDEFHAQLLEIQDLRNPKLHYRGKRDPNGMDGHIVERVDEQERHPQDIRGEDAKAALRALYGVLEVAERDIDPEKLP